jgi:UDP-N-acetylglucosamine 2-epimerase
MQDLAARVLADVRNPVVLADVRQSVATASGGAHMLHPGRYLFATVHRAENREPAALRAWAGLLAAVAGPDRAVVLALHPGTRAALEASGVELSSDIVVIGPQGYRTTLALQLHAAAVITDSGGVQREAAWLGVPCLILRSTTEWVEAVADSAGSMVTVGRDRDEAVRQLARLAPVDGAEEDARIRAAEVSLAPSGAAAAISAALR